MLKKILYYFINFFLALSIIFFLIRLIPGDPIERMLGDKVTEKEMDEIRVDLGLDRSLGVQYYRYLKSVFSLDFGRSVVKKRPVIELVKSSFGHSIYLSFMAMILAFVWGPVLGLVSAFYKSSLYDGIIRWSSLLMMSVPIFALGPTLVFLFSIWLPWLPVSGAQGWGHYVLPALTLALPLGTVLLKVTRARVLEDISSPWVMVLRAKGLRPLTIFGHLYRSSMATVFNVVGIQFSVVVTGTVVTESIFDIPGMGLLLFESIQARDYPLVQGIIISTTALYFIVYSITDFMMQWSDPRLNRGQDWN